MGAINIAIPFALITWAERSADSSLAAILTSPVPLFAAVLAPFFLPDEPIRLNGLVGLAARVHRGRHPREPGADGIRRRPDRRCWPSSPRPPATPVAPSTRGATCAGCARWCRPSSRSPSPACTRWCWRSSSSSRSPSTPDAQAIFSILWLGLLGSGLAYLCFFRLLGPWGATRLTMVAYVIPVVGIALGFLVPRRDDRRPRSSSARWRSWPASRSSTAASGDGACSGASRPSRRRSQDRPDGPA